MQFDAVFVCQGAISGVALAVSGTNFAHGGFCEFGLRVCAATPLALFANHVMYVVRLRPKKQMGRIHALGIVAMMADTHAVRDRAKVEFVTDPMGKDGSAANVKIAVTEGHGAGLPFPTVVRPASVDLFPESNRNGALPVVTMHKPNRLALDPSAAFIVARGWRRGLPTTAFAEFYSGIVRGMIAHVASASNAIGHAAGRFQRRCGAFVASSHYTTGACFVQQEAA